MQRINHEGEVNRARYMPQNPCLIATKSVSGDVLLFDYTKHPLNPSADGRCTPDLRLTGHAAEGYALAWNPTTRGHLLSGAHDSRICLWDVCSGVTGAETKTLQPLQTFAAGHAASVEDVAWHASTPEIFASAGADGIVCLWDARTSAKPQSIVQVAATRTTPSSRSAEVNCVAFSPASPHYFISGSADCSVALWDMRMLHERTYTFQAHTDEVLQVAWSPHHETVFASAAADRRIAVWDASRVGAAQDPEDAEDGPPELLFVHGGHTARISDFAWSVTEPWVVCSAAEDNIVQVWQMSSDIYANDDDDDDEEAEDEEAADEGDAEDENDGESVSGEEGTVDEKAATADIQEAVCDEALNPKRIKDDDVE